jgi:hypothetical protein
MKTKHSKHFYWGSDPKSATAAAEKLADGLKTYNLGDVKDIHVWRDPAGRRTTVEWIEER